MTEIPQTWEWEPREVPVIFVIMAMKRLSELGPTECGVIERVDTPEEVMALVQMGCCIGSSVEVRHVAPADGPMAICTCGRTLSVRKEAAAHLWVRVAVDSATVA
jgi:Fe2+ transport system protein FeoA